MMRLAIAATALICISAAFANAATAQVTDEHDRFTGVRTLKYESQAKIQVGTPQFHIMIKADGDAVAPSVTFIVSNLTDRRTGTAWKYLRCSSVNWLVDGKPFKAADAKHTGQVVRGGVIELVTIPMSLEDMAALSWAQSVEYRICNDEYQLLPSDISGFREILSAYSSS